MISEKQINITPGISASAYNLGLKSDIGYFFFYYPESGFRDWRSCRDEFRANWDGSGLLNNKEFLKEIHPYIGISYCSRDNNKGIDVEKLNARFEEIENGLNIGEKTVLIRVNYRREDVAEWPETSAVVFKLSSFWTENDTRRSLITLLIRGLVCYPSDSINESLVNYPTSYPCIPAIKHFLAGNTKPTYLRLSRTGNVSGPFGRDNYVGFVNEFAGLSQEQISKKLIKP